jgi:hypothetical protein
MANVVTYFGDVTTVGNTIVFQNLTSQGNYSIFSGNVNPAATSNITASGAFFSISNTTSLNVTSLYGTTGSVGIGTSGGAATLNVAGNTWTSNAISAPNVFATTSTNVTTLNTASITGPLGLMGIGVAAAGATLGVSGDANASNALSAPNVFSTTSTNVAALNTASIFGTAGLVGINTTASGYRLDIGGNVWVSNAIGGQNVSATSFANVTNLVTTTIVSTTGFVGINTTGGGARLNVGNVNSSNAFAGNVWASNALSGANVFATTSGNAASLNTAAIFGTAGLMGINTTASGATLNVLGNVYVSNGLGASNIYPTMNANIVSTNVTYMNLFTAGLGINTTAQAGTTPGYPGFQGGILKGTAAPLVPGSPISFLSLFFPPTRASYVNMGTTSPPHIDISTTDIFVEAWIYHTTTIGFINIASYGDGTTSGWNLQIRPDGGSATQGLYVSNSKFNIVGAGTAVPSQWTYVAFRMEHTSAQIYAWLATTGSTVIANSGSSGQNPVYSAADSFYLGAVNGVGGFSDGTTYIRDMRIISGASITNFINFTPDQAPFTATVPSYVTGTTLAYSWGLQASSNLFQYPQSLIKVAGNVLCSNALQTPNCLVTNVLATTSNLSASANKQIFSPAAGGIVGIGQVPTVGAATLQVTGDAFTSNAFQAPAIIVPVANTTSSNVLTITNSSLKVGLNKGTPAASLDVLGNVFASNALQSAIVNTSTSANTTSSNVLTITNASLKVGLNKGTPAASLDVLGNVFASNALQAPVIGLTSANAIFSNVTSNFITNSNQLVGINKASPTSNLDVSGNVLITDTVTATGIDQQLPVTPFTGTGVAGAYTNVANGVTFTVGATSETSGHEAWRAVTTPVTISSGVSVPSVGKFQLFERDSMVVGNTLWSPNGRYYFTVNSKTQTIQDYFLSTTLTIFTSTITSLYLTTAGFLQGVDSTGAVVYTSPNTATGYGPYRFAMENQGFAAIYDRYNTILYQLSTAQANWQTTGTYGGDSATTVGGYRIHTFTTVGSQRFVIPNYLSSLTVDYLIVGGGGGGGGGLQGGGGGGGGLIAASSVALSNGVYTVTVGAGGAGMIPGTSNPQNGGNSSLVNTIGGTAISQTAVGGGAGGGETYIGGTNLVTAQNGGSGGGGSWPTLTAGTGTAGQGFAGGTAFNGANYTGAGGGGAGAVGQDSTSTVGGNGGAGLASSITGTSTYYSGGGAGSARGVNDPNTALGGLGGGGKGWGYGNGSAATYYGGGGGAGGSQSDTVPNSGGNGYQGIVIIRYKINPVSTLAVSGYTYVPFSALPSGTFTLTASGGSSSGNAWYLNNSNIYDGSTASGGGSILNLSCTQPSDIYAGAYPGSWYTLTSGGVYARHSSLNMYMQAYVAGNYDFAWQFYLKNGTTDQIIIHNPYPGDTNGYWVQSNLSRILINTTNPALAQIYTISQPIGTPSVSNAWGFWTVPQTLTFRTPSLYLPLTLLIQGTDYNNSPYSANAFTFSGSVDGVTYQTLVSSSTYLSGTDYGYNIYSITTNTAWNYFQLQITGADVTPAFVNQMILNGQISWSPPALATTTNVTTANVLSIAGKVGINMNTGIGATLQVLGNVYASNTLFGTIRSPLANTTTLNTSVIYGTSRPVGFNTAPAANGPTLQFGYGNVYASNALSGQNVTVTTIQSYIEDLTRRSPHLRPTTANYISIQNWITASCNATQRTGWSVASTNVTFNTSTVGVTGSALYSSSVLGPDGRVYFTPSNATNIGVFNPKTNEFSTIVPSGVSLAGNYKYGSAVLCPNGNIAFISNTVTSGILTFNPVAKTTSNLTVLVAGALNGGVLGPDGAVYSPIYTAAATAVRRYDPITMITTLPIQGSAGFSGVALTPTGNIVGIPWTSTTIRVWNPITTATIQLITHGQTTPAFSGSVLVPDGNVVCVPYNSSNITLYNPNANTLTQVAHNCGTQAFSGGVLLPTGNAVFVPFNSSNVGMFDPVAQTYSNLVSVGATAGKYAGGTLLPDGRVIMAQYNASNVGILNTRTPSSVEFCRSPYFNKF